MRKAAVLDSVVLGYFAAGIYFWLFSDSSDTEGSGFYRNLLIGAAVFVAGGLAARLLERSGARMLGHEVFVSGTTDQEPEGGTKWPRFWMLELAVVLGFTILISIQVTEFELVELFSADGFAGAIRIFSALLTPEWGILPLGLAAMVETIFIAFLATIIAVPLAFLFSFISAKNITGTGFWGRLLYGFSRLFANGIRSIEPLIWAIIFSVWVGIGPFAGMLALMVHSLASLTKQYSELIESIDDKPVEGILSTGANRVQTIWYAVVPQIVLPFIAFTIYRWDINVRMATIIGLVGGGGIGTLLIQYQGQGLWNEVGTLALLIVVVVWIMDYASGQLRHALK